MKRIINILLSTIILLVSCPVFAYAQEIAQIDDSYLNDVASVAAYENADNFIDTINEELASENTSVLTELEKLVEKYTIRMESADDETRSKLEDLVDTTYDLIDEYESFSANTRGTYHVVYSAEVAAAIAVFNTLGYDLSAELLTHAKDNDELDSRYEPICGDDVLCSSVFTDIRDGINESGTGAFPNSGTTDEKDLYYSIHAFNYRKSTSGRVVIIEDRYDYEQGSVSETITGMVVNEMYNAQEAGVIVPFYTYIIQDTNMPSENQFEDVSLNTYAKTRFFTDRIVLGKGEYKEYTITFDVTGYKTFQTFGNLDTEITLYNAYGYEISTDDDSGYRYNALVKNYCYADIKYIVRVYFHSAYKSGELLFSATPAYKFIEEGSTGLDTYEDIFAITGYSAYTLYAETFHNQTSLITFTPLYDGEYTIEIISSYDTYLYVIDPSSNKVLVLNQDYNDDAGEGLNGKVVKQLQANIPYLIVFSAYNLTNAAQVGDVTINISIN